MPAETCSPLVREDCSRNNYSINETDLHATGEVHTVSVVSGEGENDQI